MIIRDAEGAEHFVTINVQGLDSDDDARKVARAVAESALVKTAIAGNDPNWGRIVSAAGYSGADFDESECSLAINGVVIYEAGAPTDYSEEEVSRLMRTGEVRIALQFTRGNGSIHFWTSDLDAGIRAPECRVHHVAASCQLAGASGDSASTFSRVPPQKIPGIFQYRRANDRLICWWNAPGCKHLPTTFRWVVDTLWVGQ